MNFHKVVGNIDRELVKKCEKILSNGFLSLALNYTNRSTEPKIGGDPLVFTLLLPAQHILTLGIPTAATNGVKYYWNPFFLLGFEKNMIGLRILMSHESWHSIFMHPRRRMGRHPVLWNICVDYIVHLSIFEDFKNRQLNGPELFKQHLGNFITIKEFVQSFDTKNETVQETTVNPESEAPLTDQQKRFFEKRYKREFRFYADPDIPIELATPEKLYDYFFSKLPKCPTCGKLGHKSKDKSEDKDKGKNKGKGKNKDKNKGDPSDQGGNSDSPQQGDSQDGSQDCSGGCPTCGDQGGFDGMTIDDHIDSDESPEQAAKRLAKARESAKRMAGYIPSGLDDELGELVAPVITWKDTIRSKIKKIKIGEGRYDWTRFKIKPMFGGIMTPKKRTNNVRFVCLLDTSGSMSNEDMSYGISQLQGITQQTEGTLVPADADIYWDKATKLKSVKANELKKVKIVGRGGTLYSPFFTDYVEKVGEADFIVVITDGYLIDSDVQAMQNPKVPVYWLITSPTAFEPPFGKVFQLRDFE